jgi:hypothetical protein
VKVEVDDMAPTQTVLYDERVALARVDARSRVVRLSREAVHVCGFVNAGDAVTAASVAFHALRQHVVERTGRPLAGVSRLVDAVTVTVREVPATGSTRFCFELRFPMRLSAAAAVRGAHAINDALDRWTKQREDECSSVDAERCLD